MNRLSRFLIFKILACACESAIASAEEDIDRTRVKLGCVHHGIPTEDVFWQSMDSAIAQGANDMDVDLVYDPITDFTLSEEDEPSIEDHMSRQIEDLCSEGAVDGIFVSLPSSSVVTALNLCKEANIPAIVFNAGIDVAKDNGYLFVGQDEKTAGYDAGDGLAKVDGTDTFCCINHAPGVSVMKDRCRGFGSGLEANGIKEFMNVHVNPNNCAAFEEAMVESCSPSNGNWSSVGLYFAGQPNHKCGVDFLRKETYADAYVVASDISDDLYSGMNEGLNILFGIDQQAYLQGYLPNSFLTLAATNKQIIQNEIIATGPKLVAKPPLEHHEVASTSSAILSKHVFVPFSICSFVVTSFALVFVV